MFKGSKHVGPEQHARLIQARGGEVNAYTSNDFTVFFEDVTPETLPLVIALEGERIANLDISEKTLESERQVVLEERRLRTEDDPEGRAFEALMALAFTAHPYRTPVIGWRSDVEAATVEVCRRFFRSYYAPNNLWIAIVGDFDTEQALADLRRAFGGLEPAASIPRNPTREPEQRGERRQVVHVDVRSPLLAGAWHAPASGHPDAEALDVASQILSGGRSSRLYRRLVYDAQKALSAEGAYWELADAGIFYAFASVRPDAKIEDVERLFLAEIARLRDAAREPRGAGEGQAPARGLARERPRHQPRARLADRARDRQLRPRTPARGAARRDRARDGGRRAARGADLSRGRSPQPGARREASCREEVLSRRAWLLAARCSPPAPAPATPVWEQPPPPVIDAPVVQPGALHRAELDNGLRILVLEDHRLPRVALTLTVRRGEASVAPPRRGSRASPPS